MIPVRPFASQRRKQRGAALLTAMIIVTLVVTLAASMVWQQWRAVQVEVAERARTQSAWMLNGALDWAKLILHEDWRSDGRTGMVDHLGEPWAVPLAEARLSTFLASEKDSSTDDGPDAFLSGGITDAQAKFNVTNLVQGVEIDPLQAAALGRLCQTLGVDSGIATTIATGMQRALAPGGGASSPSTGPAPLLPKSVAQLAWLGVDPQALELLRPYLIVLPTTTLLNVNTASREVLSAEFAKLDLGSAERIIQVRQSAPFKSLADFNARAPAVDASGPSVTMSTHFFEVRGRLRLDDRVLEERSLVQRLDTGQVNVLQRERIASRDEQPTP